MPSFDIVSEVDLQEARNAVDNASFAGIMLRIKNEGRGKDAIFRYCL